ncbi:hypothetical protein [Persicitalea sp.]|uniref:hypothetical protein n=1 Tax=Persicitalea sp. TaxID=3100273 RepID=UPI00359441ED
MYTRIGEHVDLCQGDIIGNVILSTVPDLANPQLYNNVGEPIVVGNVPLPPGIGVMAAAEKSSVLVLSQCCDCLRKSHISVCRIIPLDVFDKSYSMKSPKKKVEHIQESYQRAGARPDAFYLQEDPGGFPRSVAYLLETYSIPRAMNADYLVANRLLRLHQEALFDLQFRLAFCFGRFATTDDYMLTDDDKALVSPPPPAAEVQPPDQAAAAQE